MADNNALVTGNALSSLYPQPAAAPQNLFSDPSRVLNVLGQVNALQQYQAKQTAGQIFTNALNPDGSIDQARMVSGLQAHPEAAIAAQESYGSMLDQYLRKQEGDNAAFKLHAGQNGYLQDMIGSMADDKSLTPDAVRGKIIGAARVTGVPSDVYNSVLDSMPATGGPALNKWAAGYKNMAIGSAGTSERIEGPPGLNGERTQTTKGAGNLAGSVPIELPPGQADALKANQGAFVADQQGSATKLAALRPLQDALPLIEQLSHSDFGPGSEQFNKLKSGLQFAGIIDPNSAAGNATALRQEVGKKLLTYARTVGGVDRSDQSTYLSMRSNPNLESMVQPANLALVKKQIGQDRADALMPMAFEKENPGDNAKSKYLSYKSGFYQSIDPRALSYDLMTPQERTQVINSLGGPDALDPKNFDKKTGLPKSPAAVKFYKTYLRAMDAGLITPAKAAANGQQ